MVPSPSVHSPSGTKSFRQNVETVGGKDPVQASPRGTKARLDVPQQEKPRLSANKPPANQNQPAAAARPGGTIAFQALPAVSTGAMGGARGSMILRRPAVTAEVRANRSSTARDSPERMALRNHRLRARAIHCDLEVLNDKCRVCTMDDAWTAYSVFQKFALAGVAESREVAGVPRRITRHGFFEGLRITEPTLSQIRVVRRAGLANRFRNCALPVDIEEYFLLLWPKADPGDLSKLERWNQLKNAYDIFHTPDFRGSLEELRDIFKFLDKDGDGNLSPWELAKARIMQPDELVSVFENFDQDGNGAIDFQEFCQMLQPTLRSKYANENTKRRQATDAGADGATDGLKARYKKNALDRDPHRKHVLDRDQTGGMQYVHDLRHDRGADNMGE